MNRKERRQKGLKNKVATYNMTKEQIEKIVEETRNETILDMSPAMIGIVAISLHDESGIKGEELVNIMKRIKSQFDSINAKTVKLKDIIDYCETELGIRIL